MHCPLCESNNATAFHQTAQRPFYRCTECALVFADPATHLPAHEERARYETHNNDPNDEQYRSFLNRLLLPLMDHLKPGMRGLDYGSGPGPTISVMLGEAGFDVQNYDPFFAPNEAVLSRKYDFITCTETVEHFHRPGMEFDRLFSMLNTGGVLGIMTQMLTEPQDFSEWWYHRDPTHVCFYAPESMEWIAERHGKSLRLEGDTVAIFA